MVRVGEDQEILTLEPCVMSVHGTADNALGVLPERVKKASLRSRAIVSQERIRVYSYACFG